MVEVPLSLGTQLTQGPTWLEQGCAQTVSQCSKRLATLDGVSLRYTIEIIGRDEPGMHGEGDGLRQVQPMDLLSHITGDKLNGRLHFGHHPLGFAEAIETALAELCVLSKDAHRFDVRADIGGDQLAVSTYAAFEIDPVIGLANGLKALCDLIALLGQALVLTAGRVSGVLSVFKAYGRFWRTAWTTLCKRVICAIKTCLGLSKWLLGFGQRLVSGSLFGGQRRTNGCAEFMLDMEQVG